MLTLFFVTSISNCHLFLLFAFCYEKRKVQITFSLFILNPGLKNIGKLRVQMVKV
jgi:hypothetical protein